ncbi:3'-5' exonuclease [Roseateles sp. P5_E11]
MERPTSEQIAALPPYPALPLDRIHVLRDADQCDFAEAELRLAGHVGFDTESKPMFVAGGEQTGPHIVQFATAGHAFIVHTEAPETAGFLRAILESEVIVKVGFGIVSDRVPLHRKLGVQLSGGVDVSHMVRRLGFQQAVGLRAAVAIVLGQRMPKSKKVTTSNWATRKLSPQQLQYAANDAHASLLVYQALQAMPMELARASSP